MLPVNAGSVKDLSYKRSVKDQPCIIVCYSVYFWMFRSFRDPAFTGSIFVCGPLLHHVLLSSIFGTVGLFRSDMLLIFLHGLAMIFLRDSLCLSAVLPYRGYDMIFWIFPIVPCHAFCM